MYVEELVNLLIEKKLKISTAESCTGGLVAAEIIRTAGASAVYSEGFITYADEAKIKYLGVKKSTLEAYGAVSRQTVYEMAQGHYCQKRRYPFSGVKKGRTLSGTF